VTRHYGHPIQVQANNGHPLSFTWRGNSDCTYYRLDCSGDLQCEVYFDAATSIWILDHVYD
jgi:hypothetical protein